MHLHLRVSAAAREASDYSLIHHISDRYIVLQGRQETNQATFSCMLPQAIPPQPLILKVNYPHSFLMSSPFICGLNKNKPYVPTPQAKKKSPKTRTTQTTLKQKQKQTRVSQKKNIRIPVPY